MTARGGDATAGASVPRALKPSPVELRIRARDRRRVRAAVTGDDGWWLTAKTVVESEVGWLGSTSATAATTIEKAEQGMSWLDPNNPKA